MAFSACVLTVSDTCSSACPAQDKSGPLLVKRLQSTGFTVIESRIVADDGQQIQSTLKRWCDNTRQPVDLILSTGGTGFTARDVTPEATDAIIDRKAPAICQALIQGSLKVTPMAMLSRLTAGIRKQTLVINFPGSCKACDDCFTIVEPVLGHAIDQLRGNIGGTAEMHRQIQQPIYKSKVVLDSVGTRPRHSPFPMISMDRAIQMVIHEIIPIQDTELLTIDTENYHKLNHRILSEDIKALVPLPPFRASIKDGYAVIASDGIGPRKVLSTVATAGQSVHESSSVQLIAGYCMRISTGAPLPAGCDAVVQVEDTKVVELSSSGDELVISIDQMPTIGQDIRPIGCDIECNGQPVLKALTELGPIELGLLASIGVHKIPVFKRPRVAIMSTGDEVVNTDGQPLGSGQIWDSNRPILKSLLADCNCDDEVVDLGIAGDQLDDLFGRMRRGLESADVLVTSGGVSMGERDLLKQILATDFDARLHFGRVNVKPGKPVTFATCLVNGIKKYIFALPGNPVSTYVTFHLFVRPLLDCLGRREQPVNHTIDIKTYQRCIPVRLVCPILAGYRLDDRPEFARAVVTYVGGGGGGGGNGTDIPTATITGNQRSSRLMSARDANALVLLPSKTTTTPDKTDDSMASPTTAVIHNGDIVTALLI